MRGTVQVPLFYFSVERKMQMKKYCGLVVMFVLVIITTVACGLGNDVVTERKVDSYPVFIPEETYEYSFAGKSAEELYEECFSRAEELTWDAYYYIKDGVLYLDEYVEIEKPDEEYGYIYDWIRGKEIAKDVIYVDCNYYYLGANALYITSDHVLHGTGEYEDVYMENVKYARTYADQMMVLTMDGDVWCKGIIYGIGNGRKLEYSDWTLVLQDAVYIEPAHYKYMVITKDSSLYMWGDNVYGQFGDGSLLTDKSVFEKDKLFYEEPVKVADHIKMVWERHPVSVNGEEHGLLRTYFLTVDNDLLVCGQEVGDEYREFDYLGEMGELEAPYTERCTSKLHRIEY